MTCRACEDAEANPLTGSFHASCLNCTARALAHSPMAFKAMKAGRRDELQAAISKVWPDDFDAGRRAVWEWVKKLDAARAAKGK